MLCFDSLKRKKKFVATKALTIEQISVVLYIRFILNRKSEFIIYWFIINDTILYPLGGGDFKQK